MRVLIAAAHPDDEAIGASALLGCRADVCVVHVTNGAPRDSRWWPAGITRRDAYARERDREARRALSIVGAERIALELDDQETVYVVDEVIRALGQVLSRIDPDVIVTHAYEGGHPDHDTVAFAATVACATVAARAPVFEMATYHGARGRLQVGELLGAPAGRTYELDAGQRERRRAMLAAYRTQRATLAPFVAAVRECFRPAPPRDFSQPPHAGPLYYERLGMRPSAAEWRALVARVGFEPPRMPRPTVELGRLLGS